MLAKKAHSASPPHLNDSAYQTSGLYQIKDGWEIISIEHYGPLRGVQVHYQRNFNWPKTINHNSIAGQETDSVFCANNKCINTFIVYILKDIFFYQNEKLVKTKQRIISKYTRLLHLLAFSFVLIVTHMLYIHVVGYCIRQSRIIL
jgi:hypothetical protein